MQDLAKAVCTISEVCTDPWEKEEESETNSSCLQVALPFWTSSLTMTRPPTGKRLPACCYGANNKLEAMHSSS